MFCKTLTFLLSLTVLLTWTVPAWAGDPITDGLTWLQTQQQADGGFTNGFSEGSDLGTTCDTVLAIAANGQDASTWKSNSGNSPLDYLYVQVAESAVDTLGLKAKVVLVLVTTGQDPTAFGGSDLIAELNAAYDEATHSYGGTVFDHALAMLALSNAGQPVPDEAGQYLLDSQNEDGAWALFGDTESGTGDTNTTALAVQALITTGRQDAIGDALTYLHSVQNDDGGFPYQNPSDYGTDTDANSTAVVLQAILAAGESLSDWAPEGVDPLDALTALHDPDSGAFFWQAAIPAPNVLASAQAIPAMAEYTFANLPRVEATDPPGSTAVPDGAILPESGGTVLLPVAVIMLGIIALSTGGLLRRH